MRSGFSGRGPCFHLRDNRRTRGVAHAESLLRWTSIRLASPLDAKDYSALILAFKHLRCRIEQKFCDLFEAETIRRAVRYLQPSFTARKTQQKCLATSLPGYKQKPYSREEKTASVRHCADIFAARDEFSATLGEIRLNCWFASRIARHGDGGLRAVRPPQRSNAVFLQSNGRAEPLFCAAAIASPNAFRMKFQFAQSIANGSQIVGRRRIMRESARCSVPETTRNVGGVQTEESLDHRVGQPIVFRAADAVNEQIAEQHPRGQRRQQCAAAEADAPAGIAWQAVRRPWRHPTPAKAAAEFPVFADRT